MLPIVPALACHVARVAKNLSTNARQVSGVDSGKERGGSPREFILGLLLSLRIPGTFSRRLLASSIGGLGSYLLQVVLLIEDT